MNSSNGVQIISDQPMDEWQIFNIEGIETTIKLSWENTVEEILNGL